MFQRTLKTVAVGWLLVLVSASDLLADEKADTRERPSWEWTVEERIRERLSPGAQAERAFSIAAEASDVWEYGASVRGHSIQGRREPELFLPVELWDLLITFAYSEDGSDTRSLWSKGFESADLPHDFWIRIEPGIQQYLDAGSKQALKERNIQLTPDAIDLVRCQELWRSLNRAFDDLGEASLMRFLYETVAPNVFLTVEETPTAAELRWSATGCK